MQDSLSTGQKTGLRGRGGVRNCTGGGRVGSAMMFEWKVYEHCGNERGHFLAGNVLLQEIYCGIVS
jgi:hypothetical protein